MVNSVQDLIKVKEVQDDIYWLEDGGLRAVLAVPGINFSLLSEGEKETAVGQFKELLDGLDFPLEILIISRQANIEGYLSLLSQRLTSETEPLIKVQLEEYIHFITEYVEGHKVMKKLFYVVVPYQGLNLDLGGRFFRKKNDASPEAQKDRNQQLEQLETRVIYLSEKLSSIGLQPIRLNTAELTQLLFELYNPSLRWGVAPIKLFEQLAAS